MENVIKKGRVYGLTLSILSAILWGVSGNVTHYMFQTSQISSYTVVALRLLLSGIVLLFITYFLGHRQDVKRLLKHKHDMAHLLVFSIFGMTALQFFFFTTIAYSDAAVATLLQTVSPALILVYMTWKTKKLPSMHDYIVLFLAMFGVFLILTNGNVAHISISPIAFILGLITAVAFAFYTLYLPKLFRYPSILITGVAMLVGGLFMSVGMVFQHDLAELLKLHVFLAFTFTLIFGTIIPFMIFIESLRFISAEEGMLLNTVEPLTALIVSIFFFGTVFGPFQIIGAFAIMLMILLLARQQKNTDNVKGDIHV